MPAKKITIPRLVLGGPEPEWMQELRETDEAWDEQRRQSIAGEGGGFGGRLTNAVRMSAREKQSVRAWAVVVCAGNPDPDYLLHDINNAAAQRIGQSWDDPDLGAIEDRASHLCRMGWRWFSRYYDQLEVT